MILQFDHKQAPAPVRASPAPAPAAALFQLGKELQRRDYHFVAPTAATMALVNARPGNERARSLADVFGWNRPFHPALLPEALLGPMREAGVLEDTDGALRSTVRVASLGEQLYFHSAWPAPAGDAVRVGPDTCRFVRQLRACVPALAGRVTRCIELACGAGAGAIALAAMCPSASVLAADINRGALAMTRVNALLAGADAVRPQYSDLLANVDGRFDLIVANARGLPGAAARTGRQAGSAGLAQAIASAAIGRLAPGGTLLLSATSAIVDGVDPLGEELARRLGRAGLVWTYEEVESDVGDEALDNPARAGADRIAAVALMATKPVAHRVYW